MPERSREEMYDIFFRMAKMLLEHAQIAENQDDKQENLDRTDVWIRLAKKYVQEEDKHDLQHLNNEITTLKQQIVN